MRARKSAFTLIELLVVISIIALLLSILLPSLQKAKDAARKAVCQATMHQWGVILSMYANDNKGRFIEKKQTSTQSWDSVMWMESLRGYYSDVGKLRTCPSATRTMLAEDGKNPGPGADLPLSLRAWGYFPDGGPTAWYKKGDFGSIGINGWVYSLPSSLTPPSHVGPASAYWQRITAKGDLSQVPFLSDAWWVDGWPNWQDEPRPTEYSVRPPGGATHMLDRYNVNRHRGSSDIVFLDTSVRAVPLKHLWRLKWSKVYDPNKARCNQSGYAWPDWMEKAR